MSPLVPRLRAVSDDRLPDQSRFDSGAFTDSQLAQSDTAPHLEPVAYGRLADAPAAVADAAISRAPEDEAESNQTADLLEALRRRRGERESAHFGSEEDAIAAHPSTGSIRLVDVPLGDFSGEPDDRPGNTAPQPTALQAKSGAKKGRASMPSWDEIVFGARPDDD
jgi:hypothetical protein